MTSPGSGSSFLEGVGLVDVLPALIASLGVAPARDAAPWPRAAVELPPARAAVVVLVDGLGAHQLAARSGHAPFLRTLESAAPEVRCGFPATTATSLAGFGTGEAAGQHGLVGWQVRLPGTDRLLNHLSWVGGPDPTAYQPIPTLLHRAGAAGVAVSTISRPDFERSGMTRAALAGGRFVGTRTIAERVEATVRAARGPGPALVYLYWPEVDKVGHVHGPDSWQWGEAVETLDEALGALASRLPPGTSLSVTADHGMVEAPVAQRHDLAHEPGLSAGVALLGGEPRAPYVYCEPGALPDVSARWRALLGPEAVICTREEAVDQGLFGPVRPDVLPRIGDLVLRMRGGGTVLDSRSLRPQVVALRGHHGSTTAQERNIPWLHRSA